MDSQLDRIPDLLASPPPPAHHIPNTMGACMGRCIADKSSCLKRWRSTDEHQTELMSDEEGGKTQKRKKKERKLIFRIIKFKQKNRKQFIDKFIERQDLNYSRLSRAPTTELMDIQLQSLDAQTLLVTAAKEITTTNTFVPAASSRTSSSLDLEWEHEYGQHNHHPNRVHSRSWLFIDGAAAVDDADETNDENRALFNSPPSEDECLRDEFVSKQFFKTVNGQTQMAKSNSNSNRLPNFTRTSSRTSWSHISTPESLEWDIDEEQRNQLHLEDDNLDHETLELLHQIEMLKNKVLNETGDGLEGIEFPSNCESGDS